MLRLFRGPEEPAATPLPPLTEAAAPPGAFWPWMLLIFLLPFNRPAVGVGLQLLVAGLAVDEIDLEPTLRRLKRPPSLREKELPVAVADNEIFMLDPGAPDVGAEFDVDNLRTPTCELLPRVGELLTCRRSFEIAPLVALTDEAL